jgi:hypothetical protein
VSGADKRTVAAVWQAVDPCTRLPPVVYPTMRLPGRNSSPQFWTLRSAQRIRATAIDFLAHSARLTFLNAQIAFDLLEIMAQELGWSASCRCREGAAQGGEGGHRERRGSKIDREAAQGAVLEKLGVPGLMDAEVDEVIARVVRDREAVDQEEFLCVRFSFVSSFS